MASIAMKEVRAIKDFWLIWYTLGFQDIQLRYRRSALGPLWLTLSTAVMIYSMGFLYSHLFKLDLNKYFPYLTVGFISWNLILGLIKESSSAYIESINYIQNQEAFYSIYIMRILLRNLIIFFHNFLAFIPIALIFHTGVGFYSLLLFPSLFIICLNGFLWGSVIGILSTKYRDIEQIIGSFMQVIFFITPVMWMPSLLPERAAWIFQWNPFAQFLVLIRNPLMNQSIDLHAVLVTFIVTLVGFFVYTKSITRFKHNIVFWL